MPKKKDTPKVRYEYWRANPEKGKECWTVYRLNAIGQAWSVATYTDENVAKMMTNLLTTASSHESVHLYVDSDFE